MRFHVLVGFVALAACAHHETNDEAFRRMTGHSMHEGAPPQKLSTPARKEPAEQRATSAAPPAAEDKPDPNRCERTRAERVALAKDSIATLKNRLKEIAPTLKWALDHKCELRDTTGTVLVTRTKEAGGTRVAVKHGHADELVCNTAKVPPALTVEVMREILVYDNTAEDDIMFSTYDDCDDKERPSLRVRFNDAAGQKAILALP